MARERRDEAACGDDLRWVRAERVRRVLSQLLAVAEASSVVRDLTRVYSVPGWTPSAEAMRAAWDSWAAAHEQLDAAIREHVPEETDHD